VAARVRRTVTTRSRHQRNVSWGGLEIIPTTIVIDTKIILGSFVLATQFDETVLRVRGGFMVSSDQVATLERPQGAVGMIVVSEDAFATGIGAVPGPVTDIGNDGWFMWQPLTAFFDTGGDNVPHYFEIDSKAKRIVREGSRIVVVAEGSAGGTQGMIMWGYLRVLGMFRS